MCVFTLVNTLYFPTLPYILTVGAQNYNYWFPDDLLSVRFYWAEHNLSCRRGGSSYSFSKFRKKLHLQYFQHRKLTGIDVLRYRCAQVQVCSGIGVLRYRCATKKGRSRFFLFTALPVMAVRRRHPSFFLQCWSGNRHLLLPNICLLSIRGSSLNRARDGWRLQRYQWVKLSTFGK